MKTYEMYYWSSKFGKQTRNFKARNYDDALEQAQEWLALPLEGEETELLSVYLV